MAPQPGSQSIKTSPQATRISTREKRTPTKYEGVDICTHKPIAKPKQQQPAPSSTPHSAPPVERAIHLDFDQLALEENREIQLDAEETMAENVPPEPSSEAAADGPGRAYHDKEKANLQTMLRRRAFMEQRLQRTEDAIYRQEGEYLENTPNGNIIVGFENYTKGAGTGVSTTRRRGPAIESNRVFSGSSITWNPNAESPITSASSTPVQTAPTPVASSFLKGESASNHATPTSATSMSRTGGGTKKNKKVAGDDSETDTREVKKARTGSAVTRK